MDEITASMASDARARSAACGVPHEPVARDFHRGRASLARKTSSARVLVRGLADAAGLDRGTRQTVRVGRLARDERSMSAIDARAIAGRSNLALGTRAES
ncbi:MAG TPA: hypothetical protein VM509_14510 [Planctomycetota bacterium]|nr:hypothetical protein [Planctomycetota bacterium]